MSESTYSVSELTLLIKETLETSIGSIELRGEISNFRPHSSGHFYFTLKDSKSQINAIIWRSLAQKINFDFEDGLEIIVRGRVEVYPPQGKYQIICEAVKPIGEGFLQKEFEKLMRKLQAEGLFNEEIKKAIPRLPEKIGIVTSPTGAVISDICTVLERRFPYAQLVLFPVKVQGEGAADEIVNAIRYFNSIEEKPDVLIVGRGGGSLEDLWAFNEEAVARAIFNSFIPIISAVGHQTDVTIADYVADLRAGTPSMAAELVAVSSRDVLGGIEQRISELQGNLLASVDSKFSLLSSIAQSYAFNKPQRDVETLLQSLDYADEKMHSRMDQKFLATKNLLHAISSRVNLLGHEQSLKRGFALVFKSGKLVRSASELSQCDEFSVRFSDGTVSAVIK